ncbi:hypothetical protein Trydic_g15357 [Trypoxylus dichotomus]
MKTNFSKAKRVRNDHDRCAEVSVVALIHLESSFSPVFSCVRIAVERIWKTDAPASTSTEALLTCNAIVESVERQYSTVPHGEMN